MNGDWLSPEIKRQYKISRLYDIQGNLWKCKYIFNWRLLFRAAENTIELIDLDRRHSIYRFFQSLLNL